MNKSKKLPAFTLIEFGIAFVLLVILSTVIYATVRPTERISDSAYRQAVIELKEISKAIQLYNLDNGGYPPDVLRGEEPEGLNDYLTSDINWAEGPIPGTVYDYENWEGQTCIVPEVSGTVQITLRHVPDRNPDGSDVWSWYIPATPGVTGSAHCSNAAEYDKGECVICAGFDLENPPT